MQKPILLVMIAALALVSREAVAQAPAAKEQTVVTSEPGKAAIMQTIEVTATITGIDKATRTVTLKGPRRAVDVVAGDEVRNFDQLRLGQKVSVRYRRALTMELRKTRTAPDAAISELAVRAQPGQQPAAAAGRALTVIADVVAVDPKKSIISLKGPRGNVVDLQVQNPEHFKVVKKGDQVEALYFEAVAIGVTPVAQAQAQPTKK
jgi:hypothetical protein